MSASDDLGNVGSVSDNAGILMGSDQSWSNPAIWKIFLKSVFTHQDLRVQLENRLLEQHEGFESLSSLMEAIGQILQTLHATSDAEFRSVIEEQLSKFQAFGSHVTEMAELLVPDLKAKPDAVFWPNPERDPDQSLEKILPYARTHPILDKNTAIGAAGSCFAAEVSAVLQLWDFNYVVTEPLADGSNGLVANSYLDGVRLVDSSAQWGLLFNTPSFAQLAERAFEEREFQKLLVRNVSDKGVTYYSDPYREGMFFISEDVYHEDYPRHQEATRKALLESEVFIITPGLNECWELISDGSVLSRTPRNSTLRTLCRPKQLSYQENIDALQRFIDLTRHHNPTIKFIISVSPVPLQATLRADEFHVVEANSHSKAMLRVVAEEITRRNKDIYYFPSMEMILTCLPDPWEKDLRHVKRPAVERIMEMFQQMFVRQDP